MSEPDHVTSDSYVDYTLHLSTCDDCANGTPVPPDEDYICPEGLKLKEAWLGPPKETT